MKNFLRILQITPKRPYCTNYIAELRSLMPVEVKVDNNKHVLIIMAHGSEEMSSTFVSELLSYAGVKVTIAGLLGFEPLRCSHRIVIKPNTSLDDAGTQGQIYDAIYIPGSFPGIQQMCGSKLVGDLLRTHYNHKKIVAFCSFASLTMAYHHVGRAFLKVSFLKGFVRAGRRVSTHAVAEQVIGKFFQFVKHAPMSVDENFWSIRSPANAIRLAFQLIETIVNPKASQLIAKRLFYKTDSQKFVVDSKKPMPQRSDPQAWNAALEKNLRLGVDRLVHFSNSMVVHPDKLKTIRVPVQQVQPIPEPEAQPPEVELDMTPDISKAVDKKLLNEIVGDLKPDVPEKEVKVAKKDVIKKVKIQPPTPAVPKGSSEEHPQTTPDTGSKAIVEGNAPKQPAEVPKTTTEKLPNPVSKHVPRWKRMKKSGTISKPVTSLPKPAPDKGTSKKHPTATSEESSKDSSAQIPKDSKEEHPAESASKEPTLKSKMTRLKKSEKDIKVLQGEHKDGKFIEKNRLGDLQVKSVEELHLKRKRDEKVVPKTPLKKSEENVVKIGEQSQTEAERISDLIELVKTSLKLEKKRFVKPKNSKQATRVMKTKFYPPSPVTKKTKEEKERADHEMDAKGNKKHLSSPIDSTAPVSPADDHHPSSEAIDETLPPLVKIADAIEAKKSMDKEAKSKVELPTDQNLKKILETGKEASHLANTVPSTQETDVKHKEDQDTDEKVKASLKLDKVTEKLNKESSNPATKTTENPEDHENDKGDKST